MDKYSTLWQGANYQDNLLQGYRNFHLTIQSILIAVGAGLSIATITFDNYLKALLSYVLLIAISWLGIYLLIKMRRLILARGEDVDYFHNQIIECEQSFLKEERVLTAFKVYQKSNREQMNFNNYFKNYELTEKTISELTEKGKGHTRRLLDRNLFAGFRIVWACFHCIAIGSIILTILNCM